MDKEMKLSIVTTMYKSSPYIDEFYTKISQEATKITEDYEIIFVDDGSPDNSLQKVVELYEKDKKVKVIELSRNFGHHKAIMTGLSHAIGEFVFLIDSDLEEEPQLLGKFWEELHKEKDLGTIGHLGAFSFHETKNYTSAGEGGLLIINDEKFIQRAEIIREKGTNRSLFFRGMVDKYSWVDIGSSYLMNDVSAAYLWGNLEKADEINQDRLRSWQNYYDGLIQLQIKNLIELPIISKESINNAHMFYIKVKDLEKRTALLEYLKQNNINAVFHYVPLHSAPAGLKFGRFDGNDDFTTKESERLIRLPIYYGLNNWEIEKVIKGINEFFSKK